MRVYTKSHDIAQKNYEYYFHKAVTTISIAKPIFYKSFSEIKATRRTVLIVNWPEEVLNWSVSLENSQQAIYYLDQLQKDGLKILYIWHNTQAHHPNEAKNLLYNWFQRKSNFIICLNSRTHGYCEKAGIKSTKVRHPFLYNNFPSVNGDGLLVYGRIRHRSEFFKLLISSWTAHLSRREVFIGSLPDINSRGAFTRLIIKLLPRSSNIHCHSGPLDGEIEQLFWQKSKTIITFRGARHENSGILINALTEKRRVITGNCGSAEDYANLKVVSVYRNVIQMIRAILKDSKTEYRTSQFEDAEYLEIEQQSSLQHLRKQIENSLIHLLDKEI